MYYTRVISAMTSTRSSVCWSATPSGAQVPISMLADISYKTGPPSIRDENGQLVGFVFVDITTATSPATSDARPKG